jgi:hypothetical protein
MRKEDNDWSSIGLTEEEHQFEINGRDYLVDSNTAAICHAILLLVDAVNDKSLKG